MLQRAYELGVRYFLLLQDSYSPDQVPHGPFGFHGLASGAEAAILPQLRALPFAHLLQAIPKSSPHPALGTSLDEWVDVHPGVNTYFVVGNCTDLSIYQVATYLQFRAHVRGLQRRLIVPADCVATYDLSDEQASQYGTMGHPGDLLHHLFLYHLAGSGVEVVKGLL